MQETEGVLLGNSPSLPTHVELHYCYLQALILLIMLEPLELLTRRRR